MSYKLPASSFCLELWLSVILHGLKLDIKPGPAKGHFPCFSTYSRTHLGTTEFSLIFSIAVFGGECSETCCVPFWMGIGWSSLKTSCCWLCGDTAGEISLTFPYGAYFGRWSGSARKSVSPFWWCPTSRGKRSDESYKPEAISDSTEEWDILTSLRSIRTVSESLSLDGPLKYHQAPSSFHSRTDQVNPDLHHSATEIKISCSMRKSCLCHPLISDGFADEMDCGFF